MNQKLLLLNISLNCHFLTFEFFILENIHFLFNDVCHTQYNVHVYHTTTLGFTSFQTVKADMKTSMLKKVMLSGALKVTLS